jgi:hypothetical protein
LSELRTQSSLSRKAKGRIRPQYLHIPSLSLAESNLPNLQVPLDLLLLFKAPPFQHLKMRETQALVLLLQTPPIQ